MWKNIVELYRPQTTCHTAHAHCMLDTQGYKHTLTIYNTYCFSIAPVVTRTRLIVRLYVYCMSCYVLHITCKGIQTPLQNWFCLTQFCKDITYCSKNHHVLAILSPTADYKIHRTQARLETASRVCTQSSGDAKRTALALTPCHSQTDTPSLWTPLKALRLTVHD